MQTITVELRLADVVADDEVQMREKIDPDTVREYAEVLDALPPPVVFHDGKVYWLAAGFHRRAAHVLAGRETIRCEVRKGTFGDAFRFALGDNADHGLRRTAADKRRAVAAAVRRGVKDAEYRGMSDRQIATLCKVSHTFVTQVRKALADKATDPVGIGNVAKFSRADPKSRAKTPLAEALEAGEISPAAAQALAPVPIWAQAEAVARVVGGEKALDVGAELATAEVPAVGEGPAAPAVPTDGLGLPLAGAALEAFGVLELTAKALGLARELAGALDAIARHPGGVVYRTYAQMKKVGDELVYYSPDLVNCVEEVKHARPYCSVCPSCNAEGRPNDPSCVRCKGLPFVTKADFVGAPAHHKLAVEALAAGEGGEP